MDAVVTANMPPAALAGASAVFDEATDSSAAEEEKEEEKKEEEESSDSDTDTDTDTDDESKQKEEEEETLSVHDKEEIQWVLDDILETILHCDDILFLAWSDEKEREKKSMSSVRHQQHLLSNGVVGPYHQGHRAYLRSKLKQQEANLWWRAYMLLDERRRDKIRVNTAYQNPLTPGVSLVAVVVDALVNAVAWCDLDVVENGLSVLDGEKGPFNMNARKIRRKKREELEVLRVELLNANYPPWFARSYQEHLETDENEMIVLKMCYGVNFLQNEQHKRELERQEKCRPILDCIIVSLESWQVVLDEREAAAAILAAETPRTNEARLKEEEKMDRKRIKELRKETKGKMTEEEAEIKLYEEKNPPQKSSEIELRERYEAACEIEFSVAAAKEREKLARAALDAAAAAEIPTVRLRIDCAKALANADLIGLSDPFVMVFDSKPSSSAVAASKGTMTLIGTTQVVDDSLEPSWEEAFDVKIGDMEAFVQRKFRFEVYDYDIIGDNEFLGEFLQMCFSFFFFFIFFVFFLFPN